jgi:hypothetical protein
MGRTVNKSVYTKLANEGKDLLKQRVYRKDDTRELLKLLRSLGRISKKKAPPSGNRHNGRGGLFSREQLCVVKLNIGKTKDAHKKFINEYLPQKHKKEVSEKPALFSDEPVDGNFIKNYSDKMTNKHFKFIISPESQNVDCEVLTKAVVKRIESATGYKLRWLSAVHTDTGHNHAHLLINGEDKDGRDVYFDPVFVKETIRQISRDVCTKLAGPRTRGTLKNVTLFSVPLCICSFHYANTTLK